MDPVTAAWALVGANLLTVLIEKGPEVYFRITNAMQKANPTLDDVETMVKMSKAPDDYLK